MLVIKSEAKGKAIFKDCYVIGGQKDSLKSYLVHGSQTLHIASIRLLLELASILRFKVWSTDVKLAYLQSSVPLERKIYITKPAPEFRSSSDEALLLLRPLYGLSDSGDIWCITLDNHMQHDLAMTKIITGPVLYMKFSESSELIGMIRSYVDDLLRAGNERFP